MALWARKTVQAASRAELDQALGSADQVIVEGEEELLNYAVAQTSQPSLMARWLWIGGLVLRAVMAAGLVWFLVLQVQSHRGPADQAPLPEASDALKHLQDSLLDYKSSEPWSRDDVQGLAWPLVSIVAIIALFLIVRQAIGIGSDVDIQWKVTERVAGRVVIKKVKAPAPRQVKSR